MYVAAVKGVSNTTRGGRKVGNHDPQGLGMDDDGLPLDALALHHLLHHQGGGWMNKTEEVIIQYCLHPGCRRTTVFGHQDWTEDLKRYHMAITQGLLPIIWGPWCPEHKEEHP